MVSTTRGLAAICGYAVSAAPQDPKSYPTFGRRTTATPAGSGSTCSVLGDQASRAATIRVGTPAAAQAAAPLRASGRSRPPKEYSASTTTRSAPSTASRSPATKRGAGGRLSLSRRCTRHLVRRASFLPSSRWRCSDEPSQRVRPSCSSCWTRSVSVAPSSCGRSWVPRSRQLQASTALVSSPGCDTQSFASRPAWRARAASRSRPAMSASYPRSNRRRSATTPGSTRGPLTMLERLRSCTTCAHITGARTSRMGPWARARACLATYTVSGSRSGSRRSISDRNGFDSWSLRYTAPDRSICTPRVMLTNRRS